MNRKPIFDTVRAMLGRPFTPDDVKAIDTAIDIGTGALPANQAPPPPSPDAARQSATQTTSHRLGQAGTALIQKWEGCHKMRADGRFQAYPDPGSADGRPWTIGWGSTGPDIAKGTIWTKAQCDARFARDMDGYVDAVVRAIGDAPTTAAQFDALVSFHYNTGAIFKASLVTLHRQGRFADAADEFGKWIYNDRKVMQGLVNRRADEAKLYRSA